MIFEIKPVEAAKMPHKGIISHCTQRCLPYLSLDKPYHREKKSRLIRFLAGQGLSNASVVFPLPEVQEVEIPTIEIVLL